jgi:hypothetical protein
MKKYGIFEIGADNRLIFLAIYESELEAESNIPKDKKFYIILKIYSNYEKGDFELGKGAEPVRKI